MPIKEKVTVIELFVARTYERFMISQSPRSSIDLDEAFLERLLPDCCSLVRQLQEICCTSVSQWRNVASCRAWRSNRLNWRWFGASETSCYTVSGCLTKHCGLDQANALALFLSREASSLHSDIP